MRTPGTFEAGFVPNRIVEVGDGGTGLRDQFRAAGAKGVRFFVMGDCNIIIAREPTPSGHLAWHLSISCEDRHPTWDEIKDARYRLLRDNMYMAMILPPADEYVNVVEQDHVFHLHQVSL